jgi:anti-sigma regulatory factor (Ser/Thr protein kinase)
MGRTRMSWNMPPLAESVRLSRQRIVELLRESGWDEESIGYAALMTTELVTNVVEHAGTPCTLTIELEPQVVRVDVRDASPSLPVVGAMCAPDAEGGRGLALVAALSHRWGCEQVVGGKSVWFETLTTPARGPRPLG